MVSKLEMDPYFLMGKKQKTGTGNVFLDKRKLRGQLSPYEKTRILIIETLEKFGISEGSTLANDLMNVRRIYQLNKPLLCLVYLYFQKKDFKLENIIRNFDEDFNQELDSFISLGFYVKKLKSEEVIYKFRQDFISYLFLIYNFYNKLEESSSEETEYYDEESNYSEVFQIEPYVEGDEDEV